MEDRFKGFLKDALGRAGISAADLSREVGMDKAYFVDLLAGRKKTVSALAFMLAAKRLGLDPWELAGVERPSGEGSVPPRVERIFSGAAPQSSAARRIATSGIVEEGAFRTASHVWQGRSYFPIDGYMPDRQRVIEVRGDDYLPWGLPSGAVVHAVSFPRYEAVACPGRLVVAMSMIGEMVETVLRRVSINPEGEMSLMSPDGKREISGEHGRRIVGLVAQTTMPPIIS